ncbi:peptide-methionine (S)-S-oxide reductase MsrA [Luteibaculum oceani]|uniref:Peptide methionine sulfoxide reductase MsrA n=1 Tax=Luteibaculum oceani TaxID=1294296 RepID=A0A5C6UVS8_9FLAO|nr:peptide-methionine (S)-S-oxide reductase MsrA [Luteibaculum oceani]TXC77079.1 peptide-methionine (S)-S-oxide reductase MsrA [Luteibaculum oceani]
MEKATFGGGCFWCTEAIFKDLEGVLYVEPGYAGGTIKNPGYKEVCTGRTGHAEVIRIHFDAAVVSYAKLLEVFFRTHDPTTLNRQGNDVGTQYRSAVFYHNDFQKNCAETIIERLTAEGAYPNPIVTEITEVNNYYPAEDYHKNYFERNQDQPYCAMVVKPKVEKFKKVFSEVLKEGV